MQVETFKGRSHGQRREDGLTRLSAGQGTTYVVHSTAGSRPLLEVRGGSSGTTSHVRLKKEMGVTVVSPLA